MDVLDVGISRGTSLYGILAAGGEEDGVFFCPYTEWTLDAMWNVGRIVAKTGTLHTIQVDVDPHVHESGGLIVPPLFCCFSEKNGLCGVGKQIFDLRLREWKISTAQFSTDCFLLFLGCGRGNHVMFQVGQTVLGRFFGLGHGNHQKKMRMCIVCVCVLSCPQILPPQL